MTATDELRRLLDERGVEYLDMHGIIEFRGENDRTVRCYQRPEPLTLDVAIIAAPPEQAIEATLGRGTCEVEGSWHGESEMVEYHCTACDEYMAVEVVKPNGAQPPNFCPNCGRKVRA